MHEDFWGSFVEGVKIELGLSHVWEDGKKERSREEKKSMQRPVARGSRAM